MIEKVICIVFCSVLTYYFVLGMKKYIEMSKLEIEKLEYEILKLETEISEDFED